MSTPLPKLSYVLLSHNREKYIRAAIESAFAQDYEGELEYIFSDDCSTDRTFEIIKECVAEYKGNRRVVVTQTPRNLHLAGNTNHAVQFVESDWIVRADDDDISAVDRCSIVGRAIADHPGCSYVYTKLEHFTDSEEEYIHRKAKLRQPKFHEIDKIDILHGKHDFWEEFSTNDALHQVWSAQHFKEFGNLPLAGYWVDDVISNMRCCSLGYGIKIPVITAYIRKGSSNMSSGGTHKTLSYSEIIKLEHFNDDYLNTTYEPLVNTYNSIIHYLQKEHKQNTERFIKDLGKDLEQRRLLSDYWRKGIFYRISLLGSIKKITPFNVLRVLPLPLFAALYFFIKKLIHLRSFKNRRDIIHRHQ